MKNIVGTCLIFSMWILLTYSHPLFAQEKVRLYMQSAKAGSIHHIQGNFYELDLIEMDPTIVCFSSLPQDKSVGTMPVEKFIAGFNQNALFKIHGANAGFVATGLMNKKMVRYVLNLSNPLYHSDLHSVSYVIQLLSGIESISLPHDASYENISLFIDGCADCGGSGF